MAGVNLGHVQIFLEQGTPAPEGCSLYFVVGDANELFGGTDTVAMLNSFYEFHRANGVEIVSPPEDRPWGMRDYRVRDLYGHTLTFGYRLASTVGAPLKIERVDVPVRLEKRLAALLVDLSTHKQMSVSSCLEEMLLHTCEPLGEGVASPHTKRTISFIQELKKKHGIDYDCHASYRFVEG
jgi:hypothetical protein